VFVDEIPVRALAKEDSAADEDEKETTAESEMIVPPLPEAAFVESEMASAGEMAIAAPLPAEDGFAESEMNSAAGMDMAIVVPPVETVPAEAEPVPRNGADVAFTDSEMALPLPSEVSVAEPVASAVPAAADSEMAMAAPVVPPAPESEAVRPPEASAVDVFAQDLPENAAAPTTLDVDSSDAEMAEVVSAEAEKPKPIEPDVAAPVPPAPQTEPVVPTVPPPVLTAREAPASVPAVQRMPEEASKKSVPVEKKKVAALPATETSARKPKPDKVAAASAVESGRVSATSYRAQLAAHLRRYRSYPDSARAEGLWGTARVSFTVNANGQVTRARLTGSSGHALLDRAAVNMVRRASPFPPIPKQVGSPVLTVDVPVRFDRR
jgi:protein TonB